ncbi:MAG: hypothetical protein HND51_09930 [Chloroflexi bacterium]|nr:hypothetical protein [Chloroflexota bacterium]
MAKKKKKGPAPRTHEERNPRAEWTFSRIAFVIFAVIMMLALVVPTVLQLFLYR